MNIRWLHGETSVKIKFAGMDWDIHAWGYIEGSRYYWISNGTGPYLVPAVVLEA